MLLSLGTLNQRQSNSLSHNFFHFVPIVVSNMDKGVVRMSLRFKMQFRVNRIKIPF